MTFTAEDRIEINDVICMHGHLFDTGQLDRLNELFTPNITYDVTDLAGITYEGVAAIRDAAALLGDKNPLGHHVTNIVIVDGHDDHALAHSKGIGVGKDGVTSTVSYEDTLVRTDAGWRISYRKVLARRTPLSAV
jgi:hypothetical protein